MSLVSEALRKARREAAERKRPSRLPAALPEPPGGGRGTRFGAGLVLGASIALAAALLGAAATWWVVSRAATEPAGQELAPTALPAAAVAAVVPATTPTPVAGLPAVPAPTPDRAAGPAGRIPEVAGRATDEPVSEPRPTESPAPPREDRVRGAVPEPSAPAGERVFVLEADLGYARLSLGFVVARPTDPFAEVNGREVHVGDAVDGFAVEEITARGVRLRDARGPLELRLR